jgi:lipopolysaccharide transport system ATP-binding protein
MIKNFCTEAILLDQGCLIDRGSPDQVLDYYTALLAEKYREGGRRTTVVRPGALGDGQAADSASAPALEPGAGDHWTAPPLETLGHRTGNFQAVITSVYVKALGAHGNARILVTGNPGTIAVRWVALERIESATVGIMIKDRLGQEIFGVNTFVRERAIGPVEAGQVVEAGFAMPMNLGVGLYSVTAAVHAGANHIEQCYDWVEQATTIQILPNPLEPFTGLVRLEPQIEISRAPASAREADFARQTREVMTHRSTTKLSRAD